MINLFSKNVLFCLIITSFIFAKTGPTRLIDALISLGMETPAHYLSNETIKALAPGGKELVFTGTTKGPDGKMVSKQSRFFNCIDCHNVVREDPDLTKSDPVARLVYAAENNIPMLSGTTLWGIVDRRSWYNDDYLKKYGDLVRPARNDLREAIQLCARECSQGRALTDWELEAVLAYFWTISMNLEDLALTPAEVVSVKAGKEKAGLLKKIDSLFLGYSPASFSSPPADYTTGYQLTGSAERGKAVFDNSCLYCHKPGRILKWPYTLDYVPFTFKFLNRYLTQKHHFSIYESIRNGTDPGKKKGLYMPLYTLERLSDQQIEDLRKFLEKNKDYKK